MPLSLPPIPAHQPSRAHRKPLFALNKATYATLNMVKMVNWDTAWRNSLATAFSIPLTQGFEISATLRQRKPVILGVLRTEYDVLHRTFKFTGTITLTLRWVRRNPDCPVWPPPGPNHDALMHLFLTTWGETIRKERRKKRV